ncbi:DUF3967 domain-containing protein [Bacillus thuringiensis]|uniref:DUF3967 domain-containing protein n=1 Tax=Bacillus thuringiensis TaxID=1428 RepID=UPI0011A2872D|nr:DUF3967 domain-containing protein [Bacillus thuringiensis]
MSNEFGVFAKEVALHLEINTNTLRRWSLELEKHGYQFERNEKNQRLYFERDLLALSDMQRFIDKTQSIEIASKSVISMLNEKKNAEKTISVVMKENEKVAFAREELEAYTQKIIIETAQATANQVLEKLNGTLEQRDRQLVQGIRQAIEQKQLAATQEKKPWWRFW